MSAARLDDEAGMTLIELVIATGILMVVIVPITSAFLLGFLESESSRSRTADSASAQFVSSFLTTDLNSADTVRGGVASCTTSTFSPATPHLDVTWTDPLTNASTAVSYVSHQEPGKSLQLVRLECAGSPLAFQRSTVVVRNLDPTGAVTVNCDGAPCPSSPTGPTLKKVRVKLTARSTAPQAKSSYVPLPIEIEVRRRSND